MCLSMNRPGGVCNKISRLNPITNGGNTMGISNTASSNPRSGNRKRDKIYPSGTAKNTESIAVIEQESRLSRNAKRISQRRNRLAGHGGQRLPGIKGVTGRRRWPQKCDIRRQHPDDQKNVKAADDRQREEKQAIRAATGHVGGIDSTWGHANHCRLLGARLKNTVAHQMRLLMINEARASRYKGWI